MAETATRIACGERGCIMPGESNGWCNGHQWRIQGAPLIEGVNIPSSVNGFVRSLPLRAPVQIPEISVIEPVRRGRKASGMAEQIVASIRIGAQTSKDVANATGIAIHVASSWLSQLQKRNLVEVFDRQKHGKFFVNYYRIYTGLGLEPRKRKARPPVVQIANTKLTTLPDPAPARNVIGGYETEKLSHPKEARSWDELLLEKFPVFDPVWSDEVKIEWFHAFGALMVQK